MYLSQTNGFIQHLYPTVAETVEHLAKAGFTHMDVSFFTCFTPGSIYFTDEYLNIINQYRAAFDKYGVTPVQAHEPAGNSLGTDGGNFFFKKTPRAIEMAAKIGCPSITLHPGSPQTQLSRGEFVEKEVAVFKKLIPYAEKYNIELLLENIGDKFPIDPYFTTTAEDLNTIIDEVGHPLFRANWDIGHAHLNGLDQYSEITKLGTRLGGLHIHDNAGFTKIECNGRQITGDMHLPPSLFSADFDGLIRALIETEYKGTFNFEAEKPRLPLSCIEGQPELLSLLRETALAADTYLFTVGKLMLSKYGLFEG